MNSDHVQICQASWFNPVYLAAMGSNHLESPASTGDFESWLMLVEENTGQYAKRTVYARHWLNGRTPEEAIALVSAEVASEYVAQSMSRAI